MPGIRNLYFLLLTALRSPNSRSFPAHLAEPPIHHGAHQTAAQAAHLPVLPFRFRRGGQQQKISTMEARRSEPHSPSHLLRSGPGFPVAAIHRAILRFLTGLTPDSRLSDRRNLSFLNAVAIILSLLFAALVIYILLAMVLPQVYESVVRAGPVHPRLFMTLQERLMEFGQ